MKLRLLAFASLALCELAIAMPPNGKMLYQENCASCHGLTGMGGTGPKLVGDASEWKTKLFERAVLHGLDDQGKPLKSPMPHWENGSFKTDKGAPPSKAEIEAIQHYLHTLR